MEENIKDILLDHKCEIITEDEAINKIYDLFEANANSLLEKYIEHVSIIEGTDFICSYEKEDGGVDFSDKEWNLLNKIANK